MCVPLPQEWGHSSLSMFFFGGRHPSFPREHPPLSIFPCLWVPPTGPPLHAHPWCPAKGWLLPAPIYHPHPLLHTTAPFPPPILDSGAPPPPTLGELLGHSPPRMAPALPWPGFGDSAGNCSVQARVPDAGDTVPCATLPVQCQWGHHRGERSMACFLWGVRHCLELVTCGGWRGHQISPGHDAWGHPPSGTDEDTAVRLPSPENPAPAQKELQKLRQPEEPCYPTPAGFWGQRPEEPCRNLLE